MKVEPANALIVEDDPGAAALLKTLLDKHPEIQIIGIAGSADEALKIAMESNPGLIFLDVELPGKNGIQFLEMIQKEGLNPPVIFITAFTSYAIKALRQSALDYLLKPIDPEELAQAIEKFNQHRWRKNFAEDLSKLVKRLSSSSQIKFNSRSGPVMIDPSEIIYCKADWNFTEIYFVSGSKEVVTMNLVKVTELLANGQFIPVSRSILVNKAFINRIDKKHRTCILVNDKAEIPLRISILYMRKLEKFL
jgi:DNA-binding LytR/AlgR family response regulator